MSLKTINQQGVECDVTDCDKFFLGEKPKSWKVLTVFTNPDSTADALKFDACSVKHAKELQGKYTVIA